MIFLIAKITLWITPCKTYLWTPLKKLIKILKTRPQNSKNAKLNYKKLENSWCRQKWHRCSYFKEFLVFYPWALTKKHKLKLKLNCFDNVVSDKKNACLKLFREKKVLLKANSNLISQIKFFSKYIQSKIENFFSKSETTLSKQFCLNFNLCFLVEASGWKTKNSLKLKTGVILSASWIFQLLINVTQNGISLKMKCHYKLNIIQNGMALTMECHSWCNVTQNGFHSKWNVTQNLMSLNMECHSTWNVTQHGMSLKNECCSK